MMDQSEKDWEEKTIPETVKERRRSAKTDRTGKTSASKDERIKMQGMV